MQSAVSNLVDAEGIRLAGMMPDAKGQEVQSRAAVNQNELEDHPEGPGGRRQVDLETLRQFGAVAAFPVTGPQQGTRSAACLVFLLATSAAARAAGVALDASSRKASVSKRAGKRGSPVIGYPSPSEGSMCDPCSDRKSCHSPSVASRVPARS